MDRLTEALVREAVPELAAIAVITASTNHLVLSSPNVRCEVGLSPRGEFELRVGPVGMGASASWEYAGLVGRADLRRLLEMANEKLGEEPRILQGDRELYLDIQRGRELAQRELSVRAAGGSVPLRPDRLP